MASTRSWGYGLQVQVGEGAGPRDRGGNPTLPLQGAVTLTLCYPFQACLSFPSYAYVYEHGYLGFQQGPRVPEAQGLDGRQLIG